MKLIFLSLFLGLPSSVAWAGRVDGGVNPGDWKASPYALVDADAKNLNAAKALNVKKLRVRNLDVFAKVCTLNLGAESVAAEAQRLYFGPAQAVDLPLPAALQAVAVADLKLNMGCIAAPEGVEPDLGKAPSQEACTVDGPSCEQLCKATTSDALACVNEHLSIDWERASLKSEEDSTTVAVEAAFANTTATALTCQFVTALKGTDGNGNRTIFVTRASKPVLLEAGAEQTAKWTFRKAEFGPSQVIAAARLRVKGICVDASSADAAGAAAEHLTQRCDPFKRAECNWVIDR